MIGEDFYAINYWCPNYLEIESIRLYAMVEARGPDEPWRIDRTNPTGEKLLGGSPHLCALRVIVNDAVVPHVELPHFYNYFRCKEHFWSWYLANRTTRSELANWLTGESAERRFELSHLCQRAGLVDQQAHLTRRGRSFLTAPTLRSRRNDTMIVLGE